MVNGSLIRIEKGIGKLKEKEGLTPLDLWKIKRPKELAKMTVSLNNII